MPAVARQTQPRLSELHLAAWRAFLNAHAAAVARIEHDLAHAGGNLVPLTWYDVLIELLEAPVLTTALDRVRAATPPEP